MGSDGAFGQRLLARVIDDCAAKQPDRVWAAVPRSSDLTQGFVDITFRQFAKASDRAAFWLEDCLGASNGSFETFAYAGDKDIRYPIMAVAAVKVGRKVLYGDVRPFANMLMILDRFFYLRLLPRRKHRSIYSTRRIVEPSYAPDLWRNKPS